MPELPEVQVIANRLERELVGDTVRHVEVRWDRSIATPDVNSFCRQLVGLRVADVGRRAKFLIIHVPPMYLLVHLRMSGQILLGAPGAATTEHRHARVVIGLDSGRALCLLDARKFGRMYLVGHPEQVVGDLGPEPLDDAFIAESLAAVLRGRRRQIKAVLLDQRMLAGLGNIYVDEALWQARVHPLRRACTLDVGEISRLHGAIRDVLWRAIANKGTTFRDYRDPGNEPGQNQPALAVYGRAGQPCLRCGGAILRAVMAGRGTHYCSHCQPVE
jgi:formamidopyrimidine-DNA glycosylase